MSADTFESIYVGSVFAGGNPAKAPAVKVATGETIKPGYAIYVTNGQAYAAKNSDLKVSGIAASKANHDNDTAFTAGDLIEYYPIGQDTEVWARLATISPQADMSESTIAVLSATDGHLMAFAYTNAAQATDTLTNKVGRFSMYKAGSETLTKLIRVNLAG